MGQVTALAQKHGATWKANISILYLNLQPAALQLSAPLGHLAPSMSELRLCLRSLL